MMDDRSEITKSAIRKSEISKSEISKSEIRDKNAVLVLDNSG